MVGFMIKKMNNLRREHPISLKWIRALIMFSICLLCLPALAGANEEKPTQKNNVAQYDKTIGDTRVVLLAVASVNILASTNSIGNENNTKYLEISCLVEHIGTNAFSTPSEGSVTLYLQDKECKESLLTPDAEVGFFINGSICRELPAENIQVADVKACHSRRVFLHGLSYSSGTRAACVIQEGFNGHLSDFRFDDIMLPNNSVNNEKMQ